MGKHSVNRFAEGNNLTSTRIKFIGIGFFLCIVLFLFISPNFRSDDAKSSSSPSFYSEGTLSHIRSSWNRAIRSPLPQCRDVNVDDIEKVIYTFLESMPGSRREIVHFDFGLLQEHDTVFEMVVPSVKKEQGQESYDWIADVLSQGSQWERGETEYIARRLNECKSQKGDIDSCTFIDVGANFGWYATVMASLGYHVVAFEANPDLCSVVYSTMMLPTNKARKTSRVSQIRLVPYGVGDKYQKCGLYSQQGNYYGSATVKCDANADPNGYAGYEYRSDMFIAPADCFLQDVKAVHVMKIDVEGFEIMAMKGMTEMFRRIPPQYIVAECQSTHQRRHGSTSVKFVEHLENLGYECYTLDQALIDGDKDKMQLIMPFAIADDNDPHPPDRNMVCLYKKRVAVRAGGGM
eukprot:GHVS01049812.1.p1 GENE.GHVS01049812.1~~GHVS01049812.1.p1  ORF type:complete len:406 (-),score=69.93 GHVS01049812.1:306-1523(-)